MGLRAGRPWPAAPAHRAPRSCTPASTPQTARMLLLPAGLLEGRRGFNWMLLLRFFIGWVATLVVAGMTAGGWLWPTGVWGVAGSGAAAAQPPSIPGRPRTDAGRWLLPATPTRAAAFTAQGIYSPNNNTAGRRYQVDQ